MVISESESTSSLTSSDSAASDYLAEAKKLAAGKGRRDPLWYDLFMEWFSHEYLIEDFERMEKYPEYLWLAREKQWYHYNQNIGIYEQIDAEAVERLVHKWANLIDLEINMAALNFAIRRLKAFYLVRRDQFNKFWETHVCLKNGVFELKTGRLLPHSPYYMFTHVINFNFKPNPAETPLINRIREEYPEQFFLLERFLQSVLRYDLGLELAVFMYGRTGTGKGTILNLISTMFKGSKLNGSLHSLGENFGLENVLDKRVFLDKDMAISALSARTVELFKKVVGNDTTDGFQINMKNTKHFEAEVRLFFISATNQFSRLPTGTDRLAWFRRTLILVFDTVQPADENFKRGVLNEIDDWGSELLLMPYNPIHDHQKNKEEWAEHQAEIWDYSANPFKRYVLEMFENTHNPDDVMEQDEVADYIRDRLNDDNYFIPSDKALKAYITTEMSALRIRKKMQNRTQVYYPVALRPEWTLYIEGMEDIDEVMEQHGDYFMQLRRSVKKTRRKRSMLKNKKNKSTSFRGFTDFD